MTEINIDEFKSIQLLPKKENNINHELYCMDNLIYLEKSVKINPNTVDFCYIDPPYNTGSSEKNGFTYNDSFKKKEDKNRHVTWLNFMRLRLEKLKILLKQTGVVAISIDDREIHYLRILCDEIFGETNFIAQIIIDGGAMKNNAKLVSTTHEYLLLYSKNKKEMLKQSIQWRTKRDGLDILKNKEDELRKKYKNDYIKMTSNLKEWMKTSPLSKRLKVFSNVDSKGLYTHADLSAPNSKRKYSFLHPITQKPVKNPSRGWGLSYEKLEELAQKGEVEFFQDETWQPLRKLYLKHENDQVLKSVLSFPARTSTHLIENMLGKRSSFNNPKNLDFIKYIIDVMCPEDGIVLDFFAGSGTTGHAVIDLNNQGKKRQFILCTNNENNIYDEVTKPRLLAALTGLWGNGKKHEQSSDTLTEFIL